MNRSLFLKQSLLSTAALSSTSLGALAKPSSLAIDPMYPFTLGPIEGYSPYIGTLVSEMMYMRAKLVHSVKKMQPTVADLDFLLDKKANSIGALLNHLAATDVIYHATTFDKREDYNAAEKAKWDVAMNLGEPARQSIKGNPLSYYLDLLETTRTSTLAEFKKRDDKWLMEVTQKGFANKPTNTFCFWFHVTEHEAHHLGQMEVISKRMPSAQNTTASKEG